MSDWFSEVILFLTSRWGVMIIFVALLAAGAVVAKFGKKEDQEKDDVDKMVSSYSGMNSAPWHEEHSEDKAKKSKVEKFYTGKMSRWGNMKMIIRREQQTMKERTKDLEAKEKEEKER